MHISRERNRSHMRAGEEALVIDHKRPVANSQWQDETLGSCQIADNEPMAGALQGGDVISGPLLKRR